ncbi:3D domain-containing protein [Camelliibacillus cellulosilyticus]|uniref:3D domain-containing protein n=1 Tax=Camelliibacillus cellulosilyticus TaxID=2174486 RepID=A0ABV9GN41_9BACL
MQRLKKCFTVIVTTAAIFSVPAASLAAGNPNTKEQPTKLHIKTLHGFQTNKKPLQASKATGYMVALSKKAMKKKNKSPGHAHLTVKATAYTAHCTGCSGITKTGFNLTSHPDAKVIAVDPKVIPLGSKVYVPGYGAAIAADTGGAINGHHIDLYVKTDEQAKNWGVKSLTVTVMNP